MGRASSTSTAALCSPGPAGVDWHSPSTSHWPMKPEPFFQVMYTRPSRGHRLMFSPSSHWEKP